MVIKVLLLLLLLRITSTSTTSVTQSENPELQGPESMDWDQTLEPGSAALFTSARPSEVSQATAPNLGRRPVVGPEPWKWDRL